MQQAGARVLLVEDEPLIALVVEEMLADMGCGVVGPAFRLCQAVSMATERDIDYAIVDVNLGSVTSEPVIAILRSRGIPFVISTGMGRRETEEAYPGVPVLGKPFEMEMLRKALDRFPPNPATQG